MITGYQARLNLKKLVTSATVMVEVTLSQHYSRDFERFEKAIRNVPEVVECHATGGRVDYILKIVTRDVDSYQRLIDRLLEADVGIDRYFSYIVTKTVKEAPRCLSTGLPKELPIRPFPRQKKGKSAKPNFKSTFSGKLLFFSS